MPTDGLDQKQTIDAYLAISKRHRDRMDQRRSYEWKVNLALWSGLGFIAGQALRGGTRANFCSCWLWIPILMVAGAYVPWIWIIGKHNHYDSDRAKDYLDLAEETIPPRPPCKESGPCKWYSQLFQTAVTVALLVLVGASFCGRREPKPSAPGTSIKQPTSMRIEGSIEVSEK